MEPGIPGKIQMVILTTETQVQVERLVVLEDMVELVETGDTMEKRVELAAEEQVVEATARADLMALVMVKLFLVRDI